MIRIRFMAFLRKWHQYLVAETYDELCSAVDAILLAIKRLRKVMRI